MNHTHLLLPITLITTLAIFGCSESGTTDADAQSSDDNLLMDSESAQDTTGNDTGNGSGVDHSDTANGQQVNTDSTDVTPGGNDSAVGNDTAPGSDPADSSHDDTAPQMDSEQGSNNGNTDSVDEDTGEAGDTESHGHGNKDTDADTAVDSGDGDATDTSEADMDTADTGADETTDSADSPIDTDSETSVAADNDTETVSCPFSCRSVNWCDNNDGIVREDYDCDETTQVCCEMAGDADSDVDSSHNGDTDSDGDTGISCTVGCHSKSWCTANDAVTYSDLTCNGSQICCAVEE